MVDNETPTPRTVTDARGRTWTRRVGMEAWYDWEPPALPFTTLPEVHYAALCDRVEQLESALAQRDAEVAAWREAAARVCLPGVAFAEPDEWTRAMTRAAVSLLGENARLREHEQGALAAHSASVAALVAVAGALGFDGVDDYADVERAASALRAEVARLTTLVEELRIMLRQSDADYRKLEAKQDPVARELAELRYQKERMALLGLAADGQAQEAQAELTALRAEVAALREALEEYANPHNWDGKQQRRFTCVTGDGASIARAALDAARATGGDAT